MSGTSSHDMFVIDPTMITPSPSPAPETPPTQEANIVLPKYLDVDFARATRDSGSKPKEKKITRRAPEAPQSESYRGGRYRQNNVRRRQPYQWQQKEEFSKPSQQQGSSDEQKNRRETETAIRSEWKPQIEDMASNPQPQIKTEDESSISCPPTSTPTQTTQRPLSPQPQIHPTRTPKKEKPPPQPELEVDPSEVISKSIAGVRVNGEFWESLTKIEKALLGMDSFNPDDPVCGVCKHSVQSIIDLYRHCIITHPEILSLEREEQ